MLAKWVCPIHGEREPNYPLIFKYEKQYDYVIGPKNPDFLNLDKYQFSWCWECDCLKSCYYQHKVFTCHPMCLEPACGKGPYKKEKQ